MTDRPDPGYPAYPPSPPPLPAYPPYGGYPPPYAGYPPAGPRRPGALLAGAIVGYLLAGLLALSALLLFDGAAWVSDFGGDYGLHAERLSVELALDGALNLAAATLLITGGVLVTVRRPLGRLLYLIGAALVVAATVYWLGRWGDRVGDTGAFAMYAVVYGGLAIVGGALVWTRPGGVWLTGRR